MNVHDKLGVSARKGRCIGGHAPHSSSDICNKNLALCGRQAPGEVHELRKEPVVKLAKIVRLPVVASAWCEQWVKRLLP